MWTHHTSIALLALTPSVLAVMLQDFTPRASNLPPACNDVYTQQIEGCSASDFSGQGCSESCISGMNALLEPIQSACADVPPGSSIITKFQDGTGPGMLCPNAVAASSSSAAETSSTAESTSAPTSTAEASTSSDAETTTSTTASPARATSVVSTSTHTTSSSQLPTSGTSTAPTVATTSGLIVDTSSTPSPASSGAATSATEALPAQQSYLQNDGSGGGSPFDTSEGGAGINSIPSAATGALAIAFAVLAMMR